ncbi:MAG: cytochrome b/b6 domain-containing protein [Magnetococcales bacterium]|nr:cytochrome b/b6 domain-containing protein [Magnetococcales bacterium]
MHYDRFTRFIHIFLAIGISAQLAISLVMIHPKPGRLGDLFYEIHEYLGLALLGFVILHWAWAGIRRGKIPFTQLFPWLTPSRYRPLMEDAQRYAGHMTQLRLPPESGSPSPLANAIQGLGLATALLLGASGLLLFLNAPAEGARMTGWLHDVKEVHEVFGSVLWVYLCAHAGMGVLHQLSGHGSIRDMFFFWKKSGNS